jgi:hypothetical protein
VPQCGYCQAGQIMQAHGRGALPVRYASPRPSRGTTRLSAALPRTSKQSPGGGS